MATRQCFLAAGAALVLALSQSVPAAAQADALTGTVSSAEEGAMEGVLVNAKREGAWVGSNHGASIIKLEPLD